MLPPRFVNNVPSTYTFYLPRDVSYNGNKAFTEKYSHDCVDWGAHDVDVNTMWYYYRPQRSSCNLAAEDIYEIEASIHVARPDRCSRLLEQPMGPADRQQTAQLLGSLP